MNFKRLSTTGTVLAATAMVLAACGGGESNQASTDGSSDGGETQVINVAAIETAYGTEGWAAVTDAFTAETGIEVNLTMDKNLEDVIGPQMKAGDFPDVVSLALGRQAGLTETFIKDQNLTDITDVLDMTIPGEDVTVNDKLVEGFIGNSMTNPYGDDRTFLAPIFYTPTGLYYNATLLEENGWEVPTTWDEMWALGDAARAEGISLFTYPTAGYFDSFFYSMLNTVGGPEFFDEATTFSEGVWDTPEAQQVFDIIARMAEYTDPVTPAQANNQDYLKNQQLVLDNKAIFMPNGDWVQGEMADAPRADGFEWGNMALPAITDGGDRYSYTFFEQAWVPAGADNVDAAKQFVAFLYSDAAVQAFAENGGAFQPTVNVSDFMTPEQQSVYGVYDNGVKAAIGGFASFTAVPGIDINTVWFNPINGLVSGTTTEDQWIQGIKDASDQIRPNVQS